jgi:hypothetical protein
MEMREQRTERGETRTGEEALASETPRTTEPVAAAATIRATAKRNVRPAMAAAVTKGNEKKKTRKREREREERVNWRQRRTLDGRTPPSVTQSHFGPSIGREDGGIRR